jgi:thymidylate synthase ThyX
MSQTKITPEAKVLAHTTGTSHESASQIIEMAGRTCYKSFDKITDDSAEKFVGMVLRRGHESVIEHSWFVFKLPKTSFQSEIPEKFILSVLL